MLECSKKDQTYISYILTLSKASDILQLFHDGGSYHIETSPLICGANQSTGFYMITKLKIKLKTCENENDLDIFLNGPTIARNGIIIPMLLTKAIFLKFTQQKVYLLAHAV